ncbi:MAG: hypothetical protein KF819_12410 [Labilithrix sp.]|nr:hypothetical protein [Labilithrix sp.]
MTRWALFVVGLFAGCTRGERRVGSIPEVPEPRPALPPPAAASDAGGLERDAKLVLAIPARAQAREAPKAGWCGETAIQEGLLHLGAWAPQRLINAAGRPSHPDLYSPDIPVALTELGVRHTFYASRRGFDAFARWVRAALEEGDPVLAGVKILPTAHPEWGLDHFVLVVGHGDKGLLVNTTWGTREWVSDTRTPGLSLANAFYGIRLSGLSLPPGAIPARLTVIEEGDEVVKLRVDCRGAKAAAPHRLGPRGDRAVAVDDEVTIDARVPARFHCTPQRD